MNRRPTMGNLFSGSGAWELAAKMCGIDVLFEAEIEPFPVALEAKRFPEAIQLGDVSKINGAEIPFVDILTNSSPCQGLSVAGQRKGLADERSALFSEAIRITKEMRDASRLRSNGTDEPVRLYPRYWCWENVPGALNSAGGHDFHSCIQNIVQVVEEDAVVPFIEGGRWTYSGVVDGDGWQVAWRTLDAQYHGVAQRRRRVFLVADFDGRSAAEVLFERESVSWNFAEIATAWEDTSRSLGERIDIASRIISRGVRSEEDGMDCRGVTTEKN